MAKKLMFLTVITLALSGCGQLVLDGQVMSPAQATAAANQSMGQASTGQGGDSQEPRVEYAGISFSYDESLASDVVGETIPAENDQGAPFWAASPQYTQFTFADYLLPDTFHQPRIMVYPVKEFEAMNPTAAKTIADLRYFLATRPAVPPEGGFEGEGIPLLPIFNAAQVMATQMEYVDFQNGSGVRFVTQYDQARVALNNYELFYTYQGLTSDGAYYVAAILPVSHPTLAAEAEPIDEAEFETYLDETVARLDAQAGASFTPDLGLLDALFRSLEVG